MPVSPLSITYTRSCGGGTDIARSVIPLTQNDEVVQPCILRARILRLSFPLFKTSLSLVQNSCVVAIVLTAATSSLSSSWGHCCQIILYRKRHLNRSQMLLLLLYLLACCLRQSVAVQEVVDLGYAKYRGLDFGNGVTRWAGMRYARSTSRLDGLRFTAPQDPLDIEGVVNATEVCAPLFTMALPDHVHLVRLSLHRD